MALRKPLVIVNGQIQQIQSGDELDAVIAAIDAVTMENDEANTIVIGQPVYVEAVDKVKLARANATGTSRILGLVRDPSINAAATGSIQIGGILEATTGEWDAVTGDTGGLTPSTVYYLDAAAAGMLTATAPTTVGQYVTEVGLALSTTELWLQARRPIKL